MEMEQEIYRADRRSLMQLNIRRFCFLGSAVAVLVVDATTFLRSIGVLPPRETVDSPAMVYLLSAVGLFYLLWVFLQVSRTRSMLQKLELRITGETLSGVAVQMPDRRYVRAEPVRPFTFPRDMVISASTRKINYTANIDALSLLLETPEGTFELPSLEKAGDLAERLN